MNKYSVGDIISANCPLVSILNDDKKSKFCDHCLLTCDNSKDGMQLKRCSGCSHMYYCASSSGSICQKKDWKNKHKFECPIYKQYYSILSGNLDRFLLRLHFFLANDSKGKTKEKMQHEDGLIERSFEDLLTHQSDIENDSVRIRHFEALCQRFTECNIDFDKSALFKYFCKICINSFSVLDVSLNEIGSALYIAESVFDHSCVPNAVPVFTGTYLEIRAIKNIKVGEKITINYVDLKETQEWRHKRLREQYYFDCHCERCESDFDKEFEENYKCLKELNTEMDQCIEQEDWMKAYSLGQKTIDLYHQVYGDFHPDLTVQLMRLTKLRVWISEDLDNSALELSNTTKKHIAITHGPNHELFKLYRTILGLD